MRLKPSFTSSNSTTTSPFIGTLEGLTMSGDSSDDFKSPDYGTFDSSGSIITGIIANFTSVPSVLLNVTTSLPTFLPTLSPSSPSPPSLSSSAETPFKPTGKLPEIFIEPEISRPTVIDEDQVIYRDEECWSLAPDAYDPTSASICGMLIVFGIVYILYGYRCFKAVMFLTGFIFGTVIVYLICQEEDLMPLYGNLSVSFTAGFLFGLITMLVGYVGLFMLGFHLGLLTGTGTILVIHLVSPYTDSISPPDSVWITFGTIMGWGLIGAVSALYFRKGCTILGTCLYGAAAVVVGLDYFVENLKLLAWFWEHLKEPEYFRRSLSDTLMKESRSLCLISWVLVFLWPILVVFGLLCQWFATGKGIHHEEDMVPRPSSSRRNGHLDLHKIRQDESRADQRSKKYRYLYQVRTAHGDIISQTYIQSLQKKVAPPQDQDSLRTYNSDLSHLTAYNPSSESRTTTMSHLP